MSRTPTITHAQALALGWTRTDPKPWDKLSAVWQHREGYRLEHCGHPTALWPWALYAPNGRMIGTGAGTCKRDASMGRAWRSLHEAMTFVGSVQAGKISFVWSGKDPDGSERTALTNSNEAVA